MTTNEALEVVFRSAAITAKHLGDGASGETIREAIRQVAKTQVLGISRFRVLKAARDALAKLEPK